MSHLEEFSFVWKVESFSMLPHQNGDYLTSAYFTTQIFDGIDFCLHLLPRGDKNSGENYLSCFLSRKKTDSVPIQVGFSLTLLSENGLNDKIMTLESTEIITGYGFPKFVKLSILYLNKDCYLPKDVLTIKCLVWSPENKVTSSKLKDNLEIENASQISSITRIQVNKKCLIWPIKNVEELRLSKSKTSYHIESALENIPSLELVFSLGDDSNGEHAQIDITQCSIKSSISAIKSVFVKCAMTVMSVSEEYQHSQEDTFSFELKALQTWHFPKFIAINNLKADKYIHLNDALYILCDFSFSSKGYQTFHEQRPALSHVFQMPHVPQASPLSNNIQKLYANATFCDVELRVGDVTFPGHKVVLCAQSPVFLAMFTKEMEEKGTNDMDEKRPSVPMLTSMDANGTNVAVLASDMDERPNAAILTVNKVDEKSTNVAMLTNDMEEKSTTVAMVTDNMDEKRPSVPMLTSMDENGTNVAMLTSDMDEKRPNAAILTVNNVDEKNTNVAMLTNDMEEKSTTVAMVTDNMEEKSTSVVEIEDFEGHTIQMMLEFLYSDEIKDADYLDRIEICNLYSAAHKYQILPLKQFCTRLLLSTMVYYGPCSVLSLADRHQDNFLMSCALHFIQTWGIEYFQTEDWKDFLDENPSLCGKVMIEVMKKV